MASTPLPGRPSPSVLSGEHDVEHDHVVVETGRALKPDLSVRQAGAKKIHFRVSSPPTTGPCHYGIDTPRKEELIASSHSVEEIAAYIGADSLGYLSHEGLMGSVGEDEGKYCSACFSGNYPIPLPEEGKDQLRLFEKVRE